MRHHHHPHSREHRADCHSEGRARFFEFMGRRGGGGGPDFPPFGRGPFGGRGGDGFRIGRMVADGDLRLIVLSLIEQQPRHGYDVIKAIEELTSGSYSPSPGVVYPTLTYLEEAGHAEATSEGNKKVYAITDAGRAHLAANRDHVTALIDNLAHVGRKIAQARAWFGRDGDGPRPDAPDRDIPGVVPELNDARRMLKRAIANRMGGSPEEQRRVAEILRKAAAEIDASQEPSVDI